MGSGGGVDKAGRAPVQHSCGESRKRAFVAGPPFDIITGQVWACLCLSPPDLYPVTGDVAGRVDAGSDGWGQVMTTDDYRGCIRADLAEAVDGAQAVIIVRIVPGKTVIINLLVPQDIVPA